MIQLIKQAENGKEGDDAYLIVYRDLSWNNQPVQISEYASCNYAIYSPRYGLIDMLINIRQNILEKRSALLFLRRRP